MNYSNQPSASEGHMRFRRKKLACHSFVFRVPDVLQQASSFRIHQYPHSFYVLEDLLPLSITGKWRTSAAYFGMTLGTAIVPYLSGSIGKVSPGLSKSCPDPIISRRRLKTHLTLIPDSKSQIGWYFLGFSCGRSLTHSGVHPPMRPTSDPECVVSGAYYTK